MRQQDAVNVLLVDDDDTNSGQILASLEAHGGFLVGHVRTLGDAEASLQTTPAAAILLSLSPKTNPPLAAVALLQAAAPRVPIIIIASEAEEAAALKAVHYGAADMLIRSQIYEMVLTRCIRHAIERYRAEDRQTEMQRALKWERDFNLALVDTAACLFMVTDVAGRIVQFNRTCESISGYSNHEVRLRYPWDFLIPDEERVGVVESFRARVEGQAPAVFENHWLARDGSRHVVEWTTTILNDGEGRPEFVIATGIEVTKRKAAENAVRVSEARYRSLFEHSRDAIFVTDQNGMLVEVNEAMVELLGFARDELMGRPIESLFADAPDRLLLLQEQQARRAVTDMEVRMRRRDGRIAWCLTSLVERPASDALPGYQGIIHDISDRKRAEERLLYNAYHDVLTGLPNRARFLDRLDRAIARWRRHSADRFAVMFIDLNRFKIVNDSLGHSVGDELLKKVGQLIQSCVRDEDTIARLGGDEFAILLDRAESGSEPALVAQRIHAQMEESIRVGNHDVFTSCSIGVALPDSADATPEDLLRNADIAMYRSKAEGRGHTTVYTPRMHTMAVSLMQLDMELNEAVRNNEFVLHYQPIYSTAKGHVSGFEALLRWHNPRRGLLLPQEFLPLAEETGLILPIGKWVIKQACAQLAAWQETMPGKKLPFMALNITGGQLTQQGFVLETAAMLREARVDPTGIMFELTETSLLQNPESCAVTIGKLRNLGFRFCIDDFGTGYSSLSYLHRLPINGLKIDRSFISGLDRGEGSELVSTIVSLANNLGIYAVAEGVETESQFQSVKALGPRYMQGYYLSMPLEATGAGQIVTVAA